MASKLPYIIVPTPVDGVRADLPWQLLPATTLVDAENVVLRDGFIVLRPGILHNINLDESLATDPSEPNVYGIASYLQADGTGREVVWYQHSDDTLGTVVGRLVYSNAFSTAITPAGNALVQGPIAWRIFPVGTPIENFLVWCNGTDSAAHVIQVWDSESDAATFGNVTNAPKANAIMILAETLIALGLPVSDLGGMGWRVSTHLTYEFPAVVRQQGLLADTPGPIVAALEMGLLRGAVYKTDSIYVFSAGSSTDAPFTTELVAQGIDGPIHRAAICTGHDGVHYWISRTLDLWQFDGVNAKIVTPAFKALVLNMIGSSPELDAAASEYRNTDTENDNSAATAWQTFWITFDRPNQELVVGLGTATISGSHADTPYTLGLRVKLDGKYSLWPQRWKGDVLAATSYVNGFTGGVQPSSIVAATIDDNGHIAIGYEGHWSGAGGQSDRSDGTDTTGDNVVYAPGYVHRTHDRFRVEDTPGAGTYTATNYAIAGYLKYSALKPPTDDPYRLFMFSETDLDFTGLGNTSISDVYGASAPTESETVWGQSHAGELLDPTLSTGARTSGYMFALRLDWASNPVAAPSGAAPTWPVTSRGPFYVGGRMFVAPRGFRR